jgi:hypothetical protein
MHKPNREREISRKKDEINDFLLINFPSSCTIQHTYFLKSLLKLYIHLEINKKYKKKRRKIHEKQ